MATIKPETTVKTKIILIGGDDEKAELIKALLDGGFLERLKELTLVHPFYFEDDGREARGQLEELLGQHKCVMATMSKTTISTTRKVPIKTAAPVDDGQRTLWEYAAEVGVDGQEPESQPPLAGRIINLISEHGPQSAQNVAQILGLSIDDTDKALQELFESGMAEPNGPVWELIDNDDEE